VVGGWRRLHNEELLKLYASSNNIRVVKSRSMRWGRVVLMGEMRTVYKIFVGNPKEKGQVGKFSRR